MRQLLLATALLCATLTFAGCEQKEKVLDIETPNREVEVLKSEDTGNLEIEVEKND